MKKSIITLSIIILFISSCKNQTEKSNRKLPKRNEPKNVSFKIENTKNWFEENKNNIKNLDIVFAINRVDKENFTKLDSVIIPTDLTGDKEFYLPFPFEVSSLDKVDKIIVFSYPAQAFATYEYGILTYTGPTSMGSKTHKTPTGLFFTNWKAEETTSTFNDEWELKWNFNIENKEGVGFHEYSLPGFPASHSCLRLLEKDAKHLYNWADQWVLANAETVKIKGTPVVVFGSYNFNEPKPWLQLVNNPKALSLSENEINSIIKPHLNTILKEQEKRIASKK
ncbi:L,D-transpeptidase [uncultured Flavobacterium sp.]|uniref:L,D-transpeptidase n=1 Tax=uncultured Flavobacterium sp. TaxID=165435 RepID=UPI0030ED5F0B|tara:strand:- start:299875 stop:300717 length:843 start_codon:yes stop_codon:yes gene_type:complete